MDVVLKFKKAFEFLYHSILAGNSSHDFIKIKRNNVGNITLSGAGGNIWLDTTVPCSDVLVFGSSNPYVVSRQQLKLILRQVKSTFGIYVDSVSSETKVFYDNLNSVLETANEYPEWPSVVYGTSFTRLPNFADGLSVHYAVSVKDNCSYFNHVDITQNTDGFVEYVGTNRHRISIYTTNKSLLISNILIPVKIARFLYKQRWIDLNQANCRLSDDGKYLFIGDGITRILVKLGDSSFFPDYEKLFLDTSKLRVFAVNKKKLLNGLSTVKLPFTKNLIVTFDKQAILKSEGALSESFLPCQISPGEPVSFQVNYGYFYDAVKAVRGKNVRILTNGEGSKILVVGDDVAQKNLIQPIVKLPIYI